MNYLDQIRAALWGREVRWDASMTKSECETLLRMHAKQGTGPLVYPYLLEQPDVPAAVRQHMKMVCLQTMQQQAKISHVFIQAWTALENAGIHAVLMKGGGLAALYPEPHYRTWGDIDLFLGIDQYHPACAVMRETFPDALKFDEELDHYKHYNLIADGISIEVHRTSVGFQHPIDARRYARMERRGMSHCETIEVSGIQVRVPEPTFNALFVCVHAWEHMMTQGANIRQLCDLALLLHHYKDRIDRKQLAHDLKALHMTDVWNVFMAMLEALEYEIGKEEGKSLTDDVHRRAKRLIDDMLAGRLVAPQLTETTPKGRWSRKMHTMQERLRNAKRIKTYSPAYARHMVSETMLHGACRLFAKDRHWE